MFSFHGTYKIDVNHYSGNISRRRTIREDRDFAKDVARETAIEAFREEHEIAERNRQIEEEDRERARQLQLQLIKEEQEKALLAQDSDEMLAKRLQQEEERRLQAERRKRMEAEQMRRDERLARRLSQQENGHYQHHSGKHKTKTDRVEDSMGAMKLDDAGTNQHSRPSSVAEGRPEQPLSVNLDEKDSDEESDAMAKLSHDEMIARRMQREEVQRSLSEEQERQLRYDEKIARKMQHEEVMLAKKKTYNKYKQRVSNEIADPEPMVHVSKEKKVPVLAAAKEGNGVTLTDISRPASGKDSPQMERANDGNIMTAIDPTYNPRASANVVLTKKKPIGDAAPPPEPQPQPQAVNGTGDRAPPEGFAVVQGTRRSSGKDKEKKRGSIFSKLKKK